MGGNVKKYFKKEFQLEMFSLEHDSVSDFYIACWQRNRSCLPLLLLRTLIFIGCVSLLVTSIVITITDQMISIGSWFMFMTHWGIFFITATSGLALAVSLVAFLQGPTDSSFGLPWYVKLYWIVYNMTIAIAFFITVFYWTLLSEIAEEYAVNPVLDVFIHGINSVFMLVLVVTSRHPTRLLHFYLPLSVGIVYMLFSVIFYLAGGISPFGTSWIYPMLDWSKPGETIIMVIVSAFIIIVIHAIVVAISVCRDALTKRFRDTTVLTISDERFS